MNATEAITWNTATEAFQSLLLQFRDTVGAGRFGEILQDMTDEETPAGQMELIAAIAASDHVQDGW